MQNALQAINETFSREFEEKGFSTVPFPDSLRQEMLAAIEEHLRELGSPYIGAKAASATLEEIALSIPDAVWSKKMHRGFRMFSDSLCQKIHSWADLEIVRKRAGRTKSTVSGVYQEEIELNPKLRKNSFAIYWRCVRPGKPDAGRPHRDADFWMMTLEGNYDLSVAAPFDYVRDCLKVWIPLQGCTPLTTLQFIQGSHKVDCPLVIEDTEYGKRPTLSNEWLEQHKNDYISPIELSQGSCTVFHMNLVHRGPVHNNTQLRISAELCLIVA